MSGTLRYEVLVPGADNWVTLGMLTPGMPEGSITDITACGRDVLLFRCEGTRSVVCRSAGGIDFTAGQVRAVLPLEGRETLAELGDGQCYERNVLSDKLTVYRARWTHRDIGAMPDD